MRHQRIARVLAVAFVLGSNSVLFYRISHKSEKDLGPEDWYDYGGEEVPDAFEVPGWGRNRSRRAGNYLDLADGGVKWKQEEKTILAPFWSDAPVRVFVGVNSAPENGADREFARQSFGEACYAKNQQQASFCRMVFLLGEEFTPLAHYNAPDNATLRRRTLAHPGVSAEMETHGDVLVGPYTDTYFNLSLKTLHGMRAFLDSDLQFTHYFKIDDNCFFNPWALERAVSTQMQQGGQDFMIGHQWSGRKPLRSRRLIGTYSLGHFLTPRYIFDGEEYPTYMGSSYIMSRSVVNCLVQAAKTEPVFFIEDIFITGFLGRACKMTFQRVNWHQAFLLGVPDFLHFHPESVVMIHSSEEDRAKRQDTFGTLWKRTKAAEEKNQKSTTEDVASGSGMQ